MTEGWGAIAGIAGGKPVVAAGAALDSMMPESAGGGAKIAVGAGSVATVGAGVAVGATFVSGTAVEGSAGGVETTVRSDVDNPYHTA